jgi:hypothetical protein
MSRAMLQSPFRRRRARSTALASRCSLMWVISVGDVRFTSIVQTKHSTMPCGQTRRSLRGWRR